MRTLWIVGALLFWSSVEAGAEEVLVKYRGIVPLDTFTCQDINRSSFIERVCYDTGNQYIIIKLNGTYYHYCEIDPETVSSFLAAPSMGQFYNANIRSHGSDGPFDCRTHQMPEY